MATQALSNLAALQQLFAPTAQAIGGLNGAQLAIAQEQYNRAKQLENLQREQAFVRERDTTATNRAIQLANLAGERDDKRLKANEDKQLAQELSRLKAAIRAAFSEYRVKYGGTKKLEELGDINADNLAALSDLAAALTDEMGEAQVANDIAGVENLRAGRQQAMERVRAETSITQAEDEEATIQAAQSITDEDDRELFFKHLSGKSKMKPDEIIPRLSAKAAQEIQINKRSALKSIREAKLKGEGYKSALNSLREFDSEIAKSVSRNPRVRDAFSQRPLESLQMSAMAPDPKDFEIGPKNDRNDPPVATPAPAGSGYGGVIGGMEWARNNLTPQSINGAIAGGLYDAANYATGAPLWNLLAGGQKRKAEGAAERALERAALLNLIGAGPQAPTTLPDMTPAPVAQGVGSMYAPVPQLNVRQQPIFPNIARPTYPLNPGP